MSQRFVFLIALVWCATILGAADDARGQMTVREVPMNRTAAWKKQVALLQDNDSKKVPPLRISALTSPTVSASRATLPGGGTARARPARMRHTDEVPQEWRERISRASSRHGVPEALLAAVLKSESNFNPYAVSPKGALGAMQIMPATGKELGLGLRDFFDHEANLDAGTRYLASLLREFSHLELALAAYNAGPAAVRRHGGLPPYTETQNYVARVLALFDRYSVNSP